MRLRGLLRFLFGLGLTLGVLLALAGVWYWWTGRSEPLPASLLHDPQALLDLSRTLEEDGHPGQALEALSGALRAAEQAGWDTAQKLDLLHRAVKLKQRCGMELTALSDAVAGAALQNTVSQGEPRFLYEQAKLLHRWLGRNVEAAAMYEKILATAKLQSADARMACHNLYTNCCCDWGDSAKGQAAIANSERLAAATADLDRRGRTLSMAAMGALQLGRPAEAERLYRKIMRTCPLAGRYGDPGLAEAQLASLLAWEGRTSEALRLYTATLAQLDGRDPAYANSAQLHESRAMLRSGAGDLYALDAQYADALPCYEAALGEIEGRKSYNNNPILLKLAYTQLKLGLYSDAQATLDSARSYDPYGLASLPQFRDLRIPLFQGQIYTGLKQYASAELELKRTLRLARRADRPDYAELLAGTYLALGELAEAQGRLKPAEASYRQALDTILRDKRQAQLGSTLNYASRNRAQLFADPLLALLKRQGRTADAQVVRAQLDRLDQLRAVLQGKTAPASPAAAAKLLMYRQAQARATLLAQLRASKMPQEIAGLRGWLRIVTRYRGADRSYVLQGWREQQLIDKDTLKRIAEQRAAAAAALVRLYPLDPQTAALLAE